MIDGKIVLYNENEKNGTIVNSDNQEINFNLENWDDKELIPSVGLEILYHLDDNVALSIVSKLTNETQETKDLQTPETSQDKKQADSVDNKAIQEETKNSTDEDHSTSEDELIEKRINLTVDISTAVTNYFDAIKKKIKNRKEYMDSPKKLEYLLVKRFLFTAYNNLTDIDLNSISPEIKTLHDDLIQMSNVYSDFAEKLKSTNLAYREVFLYHQTEYMEVKEFTEKAIQKLKELRAEEEVVNKHLQIKRNALLQNKQKFSKEYEKLETEVKSLYSKYTDLVHNVAGLTERTELETKRLKTFEDEYRNDFITIFKDGAKSHRRNLINILDSQAYILDKKLWYQAKHSKVVHAYYEDSPVDSELSTKGYIKYFLETLDSSLVTTETKKLFNLYKDLMSLEKDYILILVNSTIDATKYMNNINGLNLDYKIKAITDEKKAIEFGMKNNVKLLTQLSHIDSDKSINLS